MLFIFHIAKLNKFVRFCKYGVRLESSWKVCHSRGACLSLTQMQIQIQIQRRYWHGVKPGGLPHQRDLSHLDLLLQASQNYSDDYIVGFFYDEDESPENFWPSKGVRSTNGRSQNPGISKIGSPPQRIDSLEVYLLRFSIFGTYR